MKRNSLVSSDALDPRRWWTLAVLCLSLLVIGLDNTILNVALPTLQRDLDATSSQLQWIVDVYMLVFAGVLLTAGSLGDRFGRKRALTFGLLVFGLGSLGSALASTPELLIAMRALMGVGGAFIMPSTLSILTATFPAEERGKAIGIWAGVSGIGIAIGPVTGGWLIEHADWSWIFLVNLPIVIVALVAGRFLVPESRDDSAPRLDPRGFVLSFVALSSLVWALIEAPSRGWTDAARARRVHLRDGDAGRASSPGSAARPSRCSTSRSSATRASAPPALPISLAFFALFGMIFFLTQYLQEVRGYSALDAGLRTMPVAAGLVIGGPLSAKLTERLGIRVVVPAGLAIVAGSLLLLSTAGVDLGLRPDRGLAGAARPRHGLRDGARDGRDHGLVARGEDERRLGDQRHHPRRRRCARRRRARIARGQRVPWAHGLGRQRASRWRRASSHRTRSPERWPSSERVGDGRLAAAAQDAFVSGMHTAALIAAAVAFAGAIVAAVFLPSEERARVREAVPA